MKDYRPAKKRATVSVGESVRILRELEETSQNRLAEVSGIPLLGVDRVLGSAQWRPCPAAELDRRRFTQSRDSRIS